VVTRKKGEATEENEEIGLFFLKGGKTLFFGTQTTSTRQYNPPVMLVEEV
jgi:hypothetical protein